MQETESAHVRQVIQELADDRVHVRRSAVGTLVNILVRNGEVEPDLQAVVVSALLAHLQDPDYSVCTASIRALRAIGLDHHDTAHRQERVQTLLGILGAEFPNVRRFAVEALAEVIQPDDETSHETPDPVAMALLGCLQDDEHGVRSAAVRALRTLSLETRDNATARTRIRVLLETLDNQHAYVRRFGISALIEVVLSHADVQRDYQAEVLAGLQKRLEDADRSVRSAAANAIKLLS